MTGKPLRSRLDALLTRHLPKPAISPTPAVIVVFVHGFILWTARLGPSSSRLPPIDDFVGLENCVRPWSMPRRRLAAENPPVFGGVLVVASTVIGGTTATLVADHPPGIRRRGGRAGPHGDQDLRSGGGPGHAADLPATFLFETAFRRDRIGL